MEVMNNQKKCLECGYIADSQEFIVDYVWDEDADDEVPTYQCPKCKNDEDNLFEDVD